MFWRNIFVVQCHSLGCIIVSTNYKKYFYYQFSKEGFPVKQFGHYFSQMCEKYPVGIITNEADNIKVNKTFESQHSLEVRLFHWVKKFSIRQLAVIA